MSDMETSPDEFPNILFPFLCLILVFQAFLLFSFPLVCYLCSSGFPQNPSHLEFSGGSVVKNLPANAGDVNLIPGSGRSPGQGNGNPLQYSCLKNPMDRGAWQAPVHGVAKKRNNRAA